MFLLKLHYWRKYNDLYLRIAENKKETALLANGLCRYDVTAELNAWL